MANRPPARHSRIQTEKNTIGCHELQARGKCSKEGASNCEQMENAGKKARPITSKKKMLKGRHVQLRANGTCSQEGAFNYEQKRIARRKMRAIVSKRELLERTRDESRANGKCSKEGPPNCEQKEFARRRTRPIAILIGKELKGRINDA